jgi:hypothetical protein
VIKIKTKGRPAETIPAGHSVQRSEDGKQVQVLDKDGKPVDGKVFDVEAVQAVLRV